MRHYLPILARKGRAVRYARPVQDNVPKEFIEWLDNQGFTSKEIVEKLSQCLEFGCAAVMAGTVPASGQPEIQDTVMIEHVSLEAYDSLYRKAACV